MRHEDCLVPASPLCEVRDTPEAVAIQALDPNLVISKPKPLVLLSVSSLAFLKTKTSGYCPGLAFP